MLNVLIAPDSFKGTLSAREVCDIIGEAFENTIQDVKITKLPVADGGEGLCSCLYEITGGSFIGAEVTGVFGEKMTASYLMLDDGTAVIETASCAGLPLAGENKNPAAALTVGVGELIKHARENGAKRILLGLGGSATNDCGTGMAYALGWRFLDRDGREILPSGGRLLDIERIIPPAEKFDLPVTAACDVDNPLYGETGAAFVYAPQKGADEETVKFLDSGLRHIADVILRETGRDVSDMPGAGAAGGMGAGVTVFLSGRLSRGIDIVLDLLGFNEKAACADVVITGEGRLDSQSMSGKVVSGVLERSRGKARLILAVCGCAGEGAGQAEECGIDRAFFSCETPKPFEQVLATCREDLYEAGVRAARYVLGRLC